MADQHYAVTYLALASQAEGQDPGLKTLLSECAEHLYMSSKPDRARQQRRLARVILSGLRGFVRQGILDRSDPFVQAYRVMAGEALFKAWCLRTGCEGLATMGDA